MNLSTHSFAAAGQAVYVAWLTFLATLTTAHGPRSPLAAGVRPRARAMSFFEYAILAAIVVGVAVIFRGALGDLLEQMWGQIAQVWEGNSNVNG